MATINEISKLYNVPKSEFIYRANGRIEWVCKHGVGHTVWHPDGDTDVHGCDGCCRRLYFKISHNS